jgi:PAS domain S-box-containing protein
VAGRSELSRLRAELEETRARCALLADNATEMIARHRPGDRAFEFASPASRRVLGYAPDELLGRTLDELVHPPDLGAVREAFAAAGDGGSVSYRARHRDGRLVWLETTPRVLAAGSPGAGPSVLAVTREITRFKELELAIERVAREWRGTFDAASDVIMLLDERLRIARANRAAVTFFERPFADLLWQPVAELLRALAPRRGSLRLPDPRRLRRRWEKEVYLAGRQAWVLLSLDPIRGADGEPAGAVHVLRDITARKQAEIALRESLDQLRNLSARLESAREQERTRIAREIHDELGHALTALKMDVAWLAGRLGGTSAPIAERGAAMSALIDRTIATVRALATALRPSILDELGLAAAIEWQAAEFGRRTGIAVRVSGPESPPDLDAECATAVFRILQEALTNVARHAGADHVRVALKALRTRIVLEVADDGRGVLPAEAAGPGSLGILGMSERARAVGGSMTLEGRPGRGTTLRLSIPKTAAGRAR